MSNDNSLSLPELNDRIALIRDNIRQLVDQAAASLGAEDEELISGRIAQQQEELDKLVKEAGRHVDEIAEKRGTKISLGARINRSNSACFVGLTRSSPMDVG